MVIRFLLGCAAAALGSILAPVTAQTLDPDNARDTLKIMRKLQCSTIDNEPAVYSWGGIAYARRQGEKDTPLFLVEGMNIRACSSIRDRRLGRGFALVSREILLYRDIETGEVLRTWENPWTGETVEVMHVANDPVNWEMFETGRDGEPIRWTGEVGEDGTWWYRSTFPLWYPNPLASPYESEIGGTYHATEMFNFFGRTDDLFDGSTPSAKVTVGWARMSDWLPWMKMNGREGIIYMHTAGRKLGSFDELPEIMKREIRENYPEYDSPPPEGDPRDNMTSWKYYKAVREGEIRLPDRN